MVDSSLIPEFTQEKLDYLTRQWPLVAADEAFSDALSRGSYTVEVHYGIFYPSHERAVEEQNSFNFRQNLKGATVLLASALFILGMTGYPQVAAVSFAMLLTVTMVLLRKRKSSDEQGFYLPPELVSAGRTARRIFTEAHEENTDLPSLKKMEELYSEITVVAEAFAQTKSSVEQETLAKDFLTLCSLMSMVRAAANDRRELLYSTRRQEIIAACTIDTVTAKEILQP